MKNLLKILLSLIFIIFQCFNQSAFSMQNNDVVKKMLQLAQNISNKDDNNETENASEEEWYAELPKNNGFYDLICNSRDPFLANEQNSGAPRGTYQQPSTQLGHQKASASKVFQANVNKMQLLTASDGVAAHAKWKSIIRANRPEDVEQNEENEKDSEDCISTKELNSIFEKISDIEKIDIDELQTRPALEESFESSIEQTKNIQSNLQDNPSPTTQTISYTLPEPLNLDPSIKVDTTPFLPPYPAEEIKNEKKKEDPKLLTPIIAFLVAAGTLLATIHTLIQKQFLLHVTNEIRQEKFDLINTANNSISKLKDELKKSLDIKKTEEIISEIAKIICKETEFSLKTKTVISLWSEKSKNLVLNIIKIIKDKKYKLSSLFKNNNKTA